MLTAEHRAAIVAFSELNIPEHATFRQLKTCCGKKHCRRCGGRAYEHGPYWYAEWASPERLASGRVRTRLAGKARTRTRYIGVELPEAIARFVAATGSPEARFAAAAQLASDRP